MRNKLALFSVIGLTSLCAFQLTGCGMTAENAQEYVDAMIKIDTTGEYDGDIKNTRLSEYDYQGTYQNCVECIVDADYLNETYDADDETVQEFRDLIEKALPLCKYEIGEAESSDQGFTVSVTFYPLDLYADVDKDAVCDETMDKLETAEISENQLYCSYFQGLIHQAEDNLDNPVYSTAETLEVPVVKGDDGKYDISDDFTFDIGSFIGDPYPDLHDVFDDYGCNQRYAQIYVKGIMDLIMFGDNLTGIEFDDVSNEEYSELHDSLIDVIVDPESLKSELGLSDSTIQLLTDAVNKMMEKVNYEIGEAEKTDDGYSVEMIVRPLDLSNIFDEDAILDQITEMYSKGDLSEDQLYDQVYLLYVEALNQKLDEPEYRDPETLLLNISESSETFEIENENAESLGNMLFYYEE